MERRQRKLKEGSLGKMEEVMEEVMEEKLSHEEGETTILINSIEEEE